MHWTSVASIGVAAALRGAIVRPALQRYRTWKADPGRVPVARRNWRGVYIPDLALIRLRRGYQALLIGVMTFAPLYLIAISLTDR